MSAKKTKCSVFHWFSEQMRALNRSRSLHEAAVLVAFVHRRRQDQRKKIYVLCCHFNTEQGILQKWKVPAEWALVCCSCIHTWTAEPSELELKCPANVFLYGIVSQRVKNDDTKLHTNKATNNMTSQGTLGRGHSSLVFSSDPRFHGPPVWLIVSITVTNVLSDLISKDE